MRKTLLAWCTVLAWCGLPNTDRFTWDNNIGTSLPNHIEQIDSETWRVCYNIDEISAKISDFVLTICGWTEPMSNEWDFDGEVCEIHEFPNHPEYAFLFPNDEAARICASDAYPVDDI